jgi:plasmid stability protein
MVNGARRGAPSRGRKERRIAWHAIIDCNLDEPLKARLRVQAAMHGRSMEDEARDILRTTLNKEPALPANLAAAIRARFAPLGGVEFPEMPREPMREPPNFGE